MGLLKKGKYLGEIKENGINYYTFKPDVLAENDKTIYVRIGNWTEEFMSEAPYVLSKINEEEQILINETIQNKKLESRS